MFIRFDTIHERDRHTDRRTDRQTPHDGAAITVTKRSGLTFLQSSRYMESYRMARLKHQKRELDV